MIEYRLNASTVSDEDSTIYPTYGISVFENGNKKSEIKDISLCKERITKLIRLCNSLELSPLHINDVVDDFLSTV